MLWGGAGPPWIVKRRETHLYVGKEGQAEPLRAQETGTCLTLQAVGAG